MQRELPAIEARGAQVIAIGQGTTDEAARVCAQMGVTYPCLGDPDKTVYRAYGLRRGGWREILLDPMRAGNEAMRKGYRVSIRGSLMAHSDWFQLPGVAIVDRAGIVRWLHRARHSGDVPAPRDVVAALAALG
jgi:alkyl-hydroperoxide reductase/thiol specific antioxidant family protein